VGVWQQLIVCGLAGALLAARPVAAAAGQDVSETVVANDNTRAAGVVDDGIVTVRLRAAQGTWRPEGQAGPALSIEALGTEGAALTVPAPLIRVIEGVTLAVSIRNDLPAPLRIHGLCTRDGGPCAPLDVPPAATRDVRFASGKAGTYHYWATTIGAPVPFRELTGALIVDPPGPRIPDRILVITEWSSLTPAQLGEIFSADDATKVFIRLRPRVTFVINGLSWPATERFSYRRGQTVRWRVINLSSQTHPMHLHGFYFTVTHMGDGRSDQAVGGGAGRRVVTQVLPSAGTLSMEWTPEREGNWLFHCHIMSHVSPDRRLNAGEPFGASAAHGAAHHATHGPAEHDPSLGMAGMVLGITVLPSKEPLARPRAEEQPLRKLTMVIQPGPPLPDGAPTAGFAISESGVPLEAQATSPGPPLVLKRDEPVEITVVNRLAEATSIHWHGLELDSFYDGVHGWSGKTQRLAPMIAPGASFVVRITPPRAGTFIYHTHLHDYRQLSSGLYGPLIVTDHGETFDPAADHVVVLGRRDATEVSAPLEDAASVEVNGQRLAVLTWRAGARNRVRLINITPDDIFNVALLARDTPVTWKPVTKDGAPVPEAESKPGPAKVRIAVGETYDFEFEAPPGRATLWLDVRTPSGRWQSQAKVLVK
jgi:FtsP/CotA-like multicopper oxidase with cupredoxin domain